MTLRHPMLLIFQGESPETLRDAIEAISSVEPGSSQQADKIRLMLDELHQELRSIEGPPQDWRLL